MNAHLKMLLNVSGMAKRNGRLPLVRADKVCTNTLMSRLVYPLIRVLRPFGVWIPCQKLVRRFWWYAFSFCQQPASMMPL